MVSRLWAKNLGRYLVLGCLIVIVTDDEGNFGAGAMDTGPVPGFTRAVPSVRM